MAFDEVLADRIRAQLKRKKGIEEKKMFGGICFLIHGKMLVGVWKQFLVTRLGPEKSAEALLEPHVKAMSMGGKTMKGLVMIEPPGIEDEDSLKNWIRRAQEFVRTLPKK